MKKTLLGIVFVSIGMLLSLPVVSGKNTDDLVAYGECSSYGIGATYNSYSGTCSCMYGYTWDTNSLGQPVCVTENTYCTNNYGYGSTSDYSGSCVCSSGYQWDTDYAGNYTCVSNTTYCSDNYGFMSTYNILSNSCECMSNYVMTTDIFGNYTCKLGSTYCSQNYGYHSNYDSSAKACECDSGYTFDENNQCVEKENSVYFTLLDLNTTKTEAVIQSQYDYQTYLVDYGYGCYDFSFDSYLGLSIVLNLGTDYDVDPYDYIVLQNDDETCDILSVEDVDSNYTLDDTTYSYGTYTYTAPTSTGVSSTFSDVSSSSPYYTAINSLYQSGVIEGYSDGTYKPDASINRAEFVKILMEIGDTSAFDGLSYNSFADVNPSDWYAKDVFIAKSLGVIDGYPDGTFGPANTVNVAEALKITFEDMKFNIPDVTGEWYQKYVDYANSHELYLDSWASLSQELTRGEMAELIYRGIMAL